VGFPERKRGRERERERARAGASDLPAPAALLVLATMVTPLVKRDVVKKRIKKFKRMQHDRKICVKVCLPLPPAPPLFFYFPLGFFSSISLK
jgi:hypothetical protein